MTSKIQPCDAGVIRTLKAHYRRRFNRLLLEQCERKRSQMSKVDLLQSIKMVVSAWDIDVRSESISNWFSHCKIRTEQQETLIETDGRHKKRKLQTNW